MKLRLFLFIIPFLTSCNRCSKLNMIHDYKSITMTKSLIDYDGKSMFSFDQLDGELLGRSGKFTVSKNEIKDDSYLKGLQDKLIQLREKIEEKKVQESSYLIGALETQIFHRRLLLIETLIKKKALQGELDKLKMTRSQYIEKYVYKKVKSRISDDEIDNFLNENLSPRKGRRKWAKYQLLKKNEARYLDYILEKYVLQLPIEVDLNVPKFSIEIQDEWTPHWGPKDASQKVIIFTGSKSYGEITFLRKIQQLKNKYSNLYVGYRPLYGNTDPFQKMSAFINFCVWIYDKEKFWNFLVKTTGDYKDRTEEKLFDVAQEMRMDMEKIRKCLFTKEQKEVISYHEQYGDYLGLSSGPVVYVSGEILHGDVTVDQIDQVLKRKMNLSYGGAW